MRYGSWVNLVELNPERAAARLSILREHYVPLSEAESRALLERERPSKSFAEEVARRLSELRALREAMNHHRIPGARCRPAKIRSPFPVSVVPSFAIQDHPPKIFPMAPLAIRPARPMKRA
jgi:hypothetical protein